MDPLDFLTSDDLLRFFHCKKTELSCMEKPNTFLSQLRDHNLMPEDGYQRVSRMKSRETQKKAVYEILDWLERERSKNIHVFWSCVFEETILNQYPTLRLLRNSLMDGSFRAQLPDTVAERCTNKRSRKGLSEEKDEEEKQLHSVKKMKKWCDDDDEEQPGPSSQLSPGQRRKSEKPCFSPLKKGDGDDLWTRIQLPVTCGDLKGTLFKEKLAKGESCILSNKRWFTPGEFEKRAGRESWRNWKQSIRCHGITLGKLIEVRGFWTVTQRFAQKLHLYFISITAGRSPQIQEIQRRQKKASDEEEEEDEESEDEECDDQEDQTSSSDKESSTDETDAEEEDEEQEEDDADRRMMVLKVTCGALSGTLHQKRFASGTRGKSVRTETSWMSPAEFVKEASGQTDASWKRDIECEGKPLSVLIEEKHWIIHLPLCDCRLCRPDPDDLENQKNDDMCCVCKREEGPHLVVCDHCPRSFHQKCHLPHVGDDMLRDGKLWMCTFCILRTVEQWRYGDELELEAAMSQQVSRRLLECQYLLLFLCSADEERTFASDPNNCLKNYSSIVQTPMWFGKVADKLQEREYHTVGEFVSDVQLIFTNCAKNNRDDAEFVARRSRLRELFDGEFKRVFNIREHL